MPSWEPLVTVTPFPLAVVSPPTNPLMKPVPGALPLPNGAEPAARLSAAKIYEPAAGPEHFRARFAALSTAKGAGGSDAKRSAKGSRRRASSGRAGPRRHPGEAARLDSIK